MKKRRYLIPHWKQAHTMISVQLTALNAAVAQVYHALEGSAIDPSKWLHLANAVTLMSALVVIARIWKQK